MSLEDLHGKDCMVQAIVSATGRPDAISVLNEHRAAQIQEHGGNPLDPHVEAGNFQSLLKQIGEPGQLELSQISSVAELRRLVADGGNIFACFARGPDTPPHIAHLGQRVWGGFNSEQQFTSDQSLITQLMEQGVMHVFVRR